MCIGENANHSYVALHGGTEKTCTFIRINLGGGGGTTKEIHIIVFSYRRRGGIYLDCNATIISDGNINKLRKLLLLLESRHNEIGNSLLKDSPVKRPPSGWP